LLRRFSHHGHGPGRKKSRPASPLARPLCGP
jgi:hypothetical protein